MIEDIRIELKITDKVHLRIEHAVPNGSAITIVADTIADALAKMSDRLKQGRLSTGDSIWDDPQVRGSKKSVPEYPPATPPGQRSNTRAF